jgi:hypothetical protein
MDTTLENLDPGLVALGVAGAMLASWCLGWWHGRRRPVEPGDDPETKFIDASMAILGLLLAFTFAMTLGWHNERRLAVVAESNAIGDFYTCASLLRQPYRSRLQQIIREYAGQELETRDSSLMPLEENVATGRRLNSYARMTSVVDEAILAGTPIALSLTNTLNNVTSSNASRVVAYQGRLPGSVVLVLLLSSIIPSLLIGKKQGVSRKVHYSGSFGFIVLVSLVVFVTLDVNQPRKGLIRVSTDSLERVVRSMAQ